VLTHVLDRLRQELGSPRLSALHSTLGLAVARAALPSPEGGTTAETPPDRARIGVRRRRRSDRRRAPRSR
jgi:hypothetical protein